MAGLAPRYQIGPTVYREYRSGARVGYEPYQVKRIEGNYLLVEWEGDVGMEWVLVKGDLQMFGRCSAFLGPLCAQFCVELPAGHRWEDVAGEPSDARAVFGLAENCTKEDVYDAFRRLAKSTHPDRCIGQGAEEFRKLDGHFTSPCAVVSRVTLIGAKGVEEAVESLGTGAEPGSTESLLTPCLAEGRGANQGLPGVGPAIGVSAVSVVVVQVRGQACDEFLGRCEVAAFQEATSQGAEPQFDLVEPRAVLGREVEDVLVIGIGQEGTPLLAGAQVFLVERQAVEFRQEFADVQAPMGVQVVEDPMEALLVGELRRDMGQMGSEIDAGACHAQVPHDLAGGDDERGDQATGAVADVFVFAFFGFARFDQDRGMFSLEDLHAGFFVGADDQLAMLIQDGSLEIQLADVLGLGVEVGIVAVEPIDAAMGFEVGRRSGHARWWSDVIASSAWRLTKSAARSSRLH